MASVNYGWDEGRRRRLLTPPLSPEELEYQSVLGQRPTREEYPPGLLRKILASAAGGATGWQQGAPAGIATARGITELPYEQATQDWQGRAQAAMAPAELARGRRAEALELEKAEADRRLKEAMGFQAYGIGTGAAREPVAKTPVLPPGYTAYPPGQPPFTAPYAPQRGQVVPAGGTLVREGQEPFTAPGGRVPTPPYTTEDRIRVARETARAQAEFREPRAEPKTSFASVPDYVQSRGQAIAQVLAVRPEFQKFFDINDDGTITLKYGEVPREADPEYMEYLELVDAIEAKHQEIMGTQRGGTPRGLAPRGEIPPGFINREMR